MGNNKNLLTKNIYLEKIKKLNSEYWNRSYERRWEYIDEVLKELEIINPSSAIEMGTAGISLMNFSDSMDIDEQHIDKDNNTKKYIFDCTITPWNIKDKKYDIFVGLQVLEHLSPNQIEVFKEIKRISKYAIITLPYKWKMKDTTNCHHMIDDDIINLWTGNEKPYKKVIKEKRIMMCYKF